MCKQDFRNHEEYKQFDPEYKKKISNEVRPSQIPAIFNPFALSQLRNSLFTSYDEDSDEPDFDDEPDYGDYGDYDGYDDFEGDDD